ncbi:DNA primase family protein [Nonomuraea typhae]|uniref:DNA primase family protein n=1 Tax=Nonomuraea typhae TaxID=2603600 RepID=UPI0012FA916B|nr:phage/plasmid primase, P4 family [Nonomuraea typhae]
MRSNTVQEQHRGQLRIAERFTSQHADALRYVHGLGWYRWDNTRWAEDKDGGAHRCAIKTVKDARNQAARLNKDAKKALLEDAGRCESASGLEGVLRIAANIKPLAIASDQLDANAFLFNTPFGTLDLRTGSSGPNDRNDLITKVAGGNLHSDENAEWDSFLLKILPDEDVRAFVQRLVGYSMLGKVTEHVMPIWTGTGANGKGTLRDALMAAFGDYAIEVDPAILMESKHERHGAFKMRLRGARLVFCSETEKGRRFAEATMKRLVGGDPIEANLMHKNPITFDPSHTLIMLTNFLPIVSGDDPAVWRRILVVPFDVVIPEDERDSDLPDRLKAAAPAVLAWAYQGWRDYQDKGLDPPEAVRVRTQKYQATSDVMARFLSERTHSTNAGREKARELYAAWSSWCLASGEVPSSEVMFAESMAKRGFEKVRTSGGFIYRGLVLTVERQGDDEEEGR